VRLLPTHVRPDVSLTGNVEEWVGASPEQAVLLGGAFDTTEDHARCYRRNDTFGPGYASLRTGFRCCSETAPAR
jgi:formylglycine-generating enzyme required for sulfatase activity